MGDVEVASRRRVAEEVMLEFWGSGTKTTVRSVGNEGIET